MTWQRRQLVDRRSLATDAGTERVTLPKNGFMSILEMLFEWTNDSARNTESILDAIDSVQVVADGSEILFSMRGRELFLWNWLVYGRQPSSLISEDPADVQGVTLKIPWGRFLGDMRFNLDLSRFTDVELRVQFSPTIAAGGFVTATGVLSVNHWIWQDGPLPGVREGYFRTTEFFQFTSAASGEERIEVPRRHPISMLAVVAREDGIEDGVDITDLELDLNNGAEIRFRGNWLEVQDENTILQRIDPSFASILFASDTDTALLLATRIVAAAAEETQAHDIAGDQLFNTLISAIAGNQITLDAAIADLTAGAEDLTADTTDRRKRLHAVGRSVPFTAMIPIMLGGEPDTALNPRNFDDVELVLEQGGAGADVRALMQELVAN